ncbi:MAG: hypothetical protein LC105_08580 [Chitinophagales bacterium]|nr:hypothetical protein [Chitinophagales bacterium]MCZ2393896.1 hypothetical protein [Chitinophagales bacterium]
MSQEILTNEQHVVEKFREMVAKRYIYDDLKVRFELPATITPEVIDDVKEYFLGTIYPEYYERKRLEQAFGNLATYIRQPKKVMGLFGNMTGALFKFGRHFFQALKAGFASLDSFIGAKKFEQGMAEIANRNGISPPMSDEEYEDCYYQMDKTEIIKFIGDVKSLFGAMVNTPLLLKTIHILDDVTNTMQKHPNIYPIEDVEGIKLGRSLLNKGYNLFSKYDEATKQQMVETIYNNEMWYVDYIYNQKENNN